MNRTTKNAPAKRSAWAGLIATVILFTLSITLTGVCTWIKTTFNIGLQQILYTLTSPLEGGNMSVLFSCLKECIPHILLLFLLLFVAGSLFWLEGRIKVRVSFRLWKRQRHFDLLRAARRVLALLSIASLLGSLWYTDRCLGIQEYIELRKNPTAIYDEYFVDPLSTAITPPEQKKNLIYLYIESMETAYASVEDGGYQPENYIPNLTALAQEHCSFSNTDKLGGFRVCYGASWTMGAILASTAGIPFAFPVEINTMTQFLPGCTTLGDILEDNGYQNVFLCGSDANFAGRKKYFQQHGGYEVYDLYTAREEGYIPPDYYVWWGYEDKVLYEIAKDKLTKLAQSSQPFNFTMLTVDTHFVNGYVCSLCPDTYPSEAANIVSCADRQAAEFIQWCSQQDFYEDTAIIIVGDHPRMDEELVSGISYPDRTVYNCFLNCEVPEGTRQTFREFTTEDMFPTVLSALGFEIEGDRLALGVNLFSDQPTLSEIMGRSALTKELAKYSPYLEEHLM